MQAELAAGVIYGPVASRRYGRSLGINLLPPGRKVCGFNCNYCECGWTTDLIDFDTLEEHPWPSPGEVEAAFRRALEEKVDRVTISGNGEPTVHPGLHDICTRLVQARDEVRPGLPLDILTNGAMLDHPQVVRALNLLDQRTVKVDAGNQRMFLTMNSPTFDITIREIMEWIGNLSDCVVQSMFTHGRRDNTGESDLSDWIDAVRGVAPKSVQVCTLSRAPADPKVRAVPRTDLETIASLLTERTGIPTEVFE